MIENTPKVLTTITMIAVLMHVRLHDYMKMLFVCKI